MNTVKTFTVAAAIAALLVIGQWLDRRPTDHVALRRAIAAQQVCEGDAFEWLDDTTVICLHEAQQQFAADQRHAAIFTAMRKEQP